MIRSVLLLTAMAATMIIVSGVVMASSVDEKEPNDTRTTAQDVDNKFSLDDDPNIDAATSVPHASVQGTGNGTYDWYSFEVPEEAIGQSSWLDIDGASPDWDSHLRLYDSSGNLISRDGNLCTEGNWMAPDLGSGPDPNCTFNASLTRDGFIRMDRALQGSGTYYVEVSENEQPIPNGMDYVLHISVANHPTSSDSTPPETTIESGPNDLTNDNGLTNDPTPTFSFTGEDETTLVENLRYSYKVENQGGSSASWSSPASKDTSATLSNLDDGTYEFYVKAIDEADNEDETPAKRNFTVDKSTDNPTVGLAKESDSGTLGDKITNVPKPTFKGTAEAGSNVKVYVDGSSQALGSATTEPDGKWSLSYPEGTSALSDGEYTIVAKATDAATNAANSDELKVTIDTADPKISFSGLTHGESYPEGAVPTPSCTADDGSSCTVSGYETAVGTHTITGEATDVAGNTGTASLSYTVEAREEDPAWTHKGFYAPVDMNGTVNTAKAGSTVPFKFEVFDGTTEITDPRMVTLAPPKLVDCPGEASQDAVETYSPKETTLRYDTTAGQFHANVKMPSTPRLCYEVKMTSHGNPTPTTALFKLK